MILAWTCLCCVDARCAGFTLKAKSWQLYCAAPTCTADVSSASHIGNKSCPRPPQEFPRTKR
eukprot:6236589-Amphidinium_carterae.1